MICCGIAGRRRAAGLIVVALVGASAVACGGEASRDGDPVLEMIPIAGGVSATPVAGRSGPIGGSVSVGGRAAPAAAGKGAAGQGVAGWLGGHAGAGGRAPDPAPMPQMVFLAGDSTVMTYTNSSIDQAGWGQFLGEQFVPDVRVDNRAIGGRTSRRFIEEGRLDSLLEAAHAGDYLLVQFGTNDSNKTATYDDGEPYFLDAASDFRMWIQRYIVAAREHELVPVLVSPPPRNSCRADRVSFNYSFGAYADAMRELATENDIAFVHLGMLTVAFLDEHNDCAWAREHFFLVRADGSVDGTHFQEEGASIMSDLLAGEIRALDLPLATYLRR